MGKELEELNETMGTESLSDVHSKYLTFWVDSQMLGISIEYVEQILGIQAITPIPDFPPYCKGIIQFRGNMAPLVDVRLRFGKTETTYTDRTCMIMLNIQNQYFGLIVDEVNEVIDIPDGQISQPVQMRDGIQESYVEGIARVKLEQDAKESIILCIDVKRVLGEHVFQKFYSADK